MKYNSVIVQISEHDSFFSDEIRLKAKCCPSLFSLLSRPPLLLQNVVRASVSSVFGAHCYAYATDAELHDNKMPLSRASHTAPPTLSVPRFPPPSALESLFRSAENFVSANGVSQRYPSVDEVEAENQIIPSCFLSQPLLPGESYEEKRKKKLLDIKDEM